MAFAAGSLALEHFGKEGIAYNEGVKVQLEEDGVKKKFVRVLKEEPVWF